MPFLVRNVTTADFRLPICTVQAVRKYCSMASGATLSLFALVLASRRQERKAAVGALIVA
ncbi:MAG: hypothetical protein AVDCRST_MAG44-885 [uncultured Sphingomonas sp.]|uniref:Uncharacterized protein n=1 Tax=uncultured Sphingomonas sp. TaxID=158754 RepID=A0A6J4SSA4_9SPHN|nr:MAG: hypothetical protein AVDCRST_MAG44-885 [uncultured Sphingomonas sp.]